jgi:transaldolase / glucose-6-phosphate isomerase
MCPCKASISLGPYQGLIDRALAELDKDRFRERIWAKDHTLWKPAPTEIANRLGWLRSPSLMMDRLEEIRAITETVHRDGYTRALLLGMGGSSLAPEVFRKTFGVADGYMDLSVLDSTDPAAVLAHAQRANLAQTLFIVSTKSGGTVETASFLKFFYNRAVDALGAEEAGRHFIAITDPGSGLAETARTLRFRHIYYNDTDIGGRYSALSCFGLAPAALMGLDVHKLLARGAEAAEAEKTGAPGTGLDAILLGAIMGELAKAGRNKLTFIFSQNIESFGDWLEQLIAESTGKEGRGIVPIVGEPPATPEAYSADRLFVALHTVDQQLDHRALDLLAAAGHPVIRLELRDPFDLGGQCFLWEMATAAAGARLGINPFDQPDVEAAKAFARQIVARFLESGSLPEEVPDFTEGEVALYGKGSGKTLREKVSGFLADGNPGDYIAIQAYLPTTPGTDAALQQIRRFIRDRYRLATTIGYGPRFLHSTGQLHKGDAGQGMFIQLTADDPVDLPIPDEAGGRSSRLTFGILKAAQAMGDRQALLDRGRRVIRLHMRKGATGGLASLFRP